MISGRGSRISGLPIACLLLAAEIASAAPGAASVQADSVAWRPDVLDGFWARTIGLGHDYDGPVHATLVRRPKHRQRDCAVLYLHGYVDYFFQSHLADYYEKVTVPSTSQTGCDFFALDLRKYGRSLPRGYKYPNFAKSLDEYFEEITEALTFINSDGYRFVLLNGHSTGALIAVRYLQAGDGRRVVTAAFLNSPFLDFNDRDLPGFLVGFVKKMGRFAPHASGRSTVPAWYGRSLLRRSEKCPECRGRWDFDSHLKPIKGFPVFFGWLRAVAIAQDEARHERIEQPILILHSAKSDRGAGWFWHDKYRRVDLVLDVRDIKREGPMLGPRVTIRPIEGGVHDLSLSDPDAQARAFDALANWLRSLQ